MRSPSAEDDAVLQEFVADWEAELAAYADDEDPLAVLAYRLPESVGHLERYDDWASTVEAALRDRTMRWLDARRAEEATWTTATINDRIGAAWKRLEAEGIVALEHAGLTLEDGWAHVGLAARAGHVGAVLYHQQDVLDALRGESFAIAFGAFDLDGPDLDRDAHDRRASEIARRTVALLGEHGVSAAWSGSPRDRIEIEPFPWQRRRFTTAPAHGATQLGLPTWRSAPVHAAWRSDAPYTREQCAQPVYAKYDTFAFDRILSYRLRGAWKLYTGGGRGHVHHHGLPHTFVRAGEITTLWPGPALENAAPDEAARWWRRARG